MKALLLNKKEYNHILKYKQQQLAKSERDFRSKRKTHHHSKKLREFYEVCDHDHHAALYAVPFSCTFSFYLYAYLKMHSEPFEFDKGYFAEWSISKPVAVNFAKIARLARVSVNTVKAAFRELSRLGLLFSSELINDVSTNAPRYAMVVNDYYLIGYDDAENKVKFKINYNTHVGKKTISLA